MDKVLNSQIVGQMLDMRLPKSKEFQKCSFIIPDGQFYVLYEHYEAYKYLVVNQLVPCMPDAEELLSDLGYIRYSWVGYVMLANKEPTYEQYKSLELALVEIAKYRDVVSVQIQKDPRFYMNFDLTDIPNIIKKIKLYYTTGNLLP